MRMAARRPCARSERGTRDAAEGYGDRRHVCRCGVALSPAASSSPCRSAGLTTANPSRQPPGEPGRLTTSVPPRRPATPRESSACGVRAIASVRMASARPGASRSMNASVASGVTSRGAKPVPPVVSTSNTPSSRELAQNALDRVGLVGHDPTLRIESVGAQERLQNIAARVIALAGMNAVRNGDDGRPHTGSFDFSTSVTSPMTIPLSTAFAMS